MLTLDDYELDLRGFRAGLGGEDMKPLVYVERKGRVIARLFAPNVDRDEGIQLVRYAAVAYAADAVVLAVDTYLRLLKPEEAGPTEVNPVTELPYRRGDLERIVEAGRAEEFRVTDAISVSRIERGESVVMGRNLPYRVANGTVDFLPRDIGDLALSGLIAEEMAEAMAAPTILDTVSDEVREVFVAAGITLEAQELMQRAAATKRVLEAGFGVMLTVSTPEEHDIYTSEVPAHPALIIHHKDDKES